jgi:hypothetical protein
MCEENDGGLYILVRVQCGHERLSSRGGAMSDCEVHEIPSRLEETSDWPGLALDEDIHLRLLDASIHLR